MREILGNDRRLLLQRELDGRLAWCQAFGRKTKSAAAPGKFHFKSAAGVGFQEQAAVGVSDRDRMIQHMAQHDVERKLRVEQRGGFQEALEFD